MRQHRRGRSSLHAPPAHEHEHEVERDVEHSCRRKEEERDERIAHRAQERGVIIIKEGAADAEENDEQIRPHQGPDLRRDGQERFHRIEQQKGRRIEHDGAHRDEHEGRMRLPPESGKVALPPADGEQCAASHAQAEQDGRQERHERIGRADRAKRVRAKKPADDERVRYIIKLLQQVPADHGERKAQQRFGNGARRQVDLCQNHRLLLIFRRIPIYHSRYPAVLQVALQIIRIVCVRRQKSDFFHAKNAGNRLTFRPLRGKMGANQKNFLEVTS